MITTEKGSIGIAGILSHFALMGCVGGIRSYGSGHIHDTYLVKNAVAGQPDYILQRINHQVFKNVPALMDNIQLVTSHLRQKLEAQPGAQPDKEVLTLVPTREQGPYHLDEGGNYWRLYLFLHGTRSYDLVATPQLAYEGGKGFGRFQALLADLPVSQLHDTIPDFHNVVNRLRLFQAAIAADPAKRVARVEAEIAFVEQRREAMQAIYRLAEAGKLPLRITHNDTKFNNVLLNQHDQAQCVIDLDTVMPGYVAYDFGDAVRTTINSAPEDEADLEKINIDLSLFKGFAQGFLEETGATLTREERNSLIEGVLLLPFIMGLRFLTDYIGGDTYYKIHFPEHNLQRARAQFQLVKKLEAQQEALQDIIRQISRVSSPVPATLKM
jgi:hypothetical protein